MDAPTCLVCGTAHWSTQLCPAKKAVTRNHVTSPQFAPRNHRNHTEGAQVVTPVTRAELNAVLERVIAIEVWLEDFLGPPSRETKEAAAEFSNGSKTPKRDRAAYMRERRKKDKAEASPA